MYCPNCGKQMKDGQKFCMECGAPIENSDSSVLDAAKTIVDSANSQTLNLNIVHRKEPSRETVPLPMGKANTSLILGILSIAIPFLGYGTVPGIIMGVIGLILSREPLNYPKTRAASVAGIGKTTSIVGIAYSIYSTIVSTIVSFVIIFLYIIYIFFIFSIMMSGMY
ncbi:MAG: zinc-ribbon domain-containing protein [Ruminococcaceae bacterium]|nr:zinc-ribbon domain-containing protein [Oscillospiraceae bacterium]